MTQRLIDAFDGIVCDLDGVVYRGRDAVPHAIAGLDGARRAGLRIAYATNNASRPPQEVRGQLSDLGLDLELRDVVTSSQAGAVHLAETLPAGATVLAIGGVGVAQALEEQGLRVVRAADVQEGGPEHGTHVEAVLQGLGTNVSWRDLAQAAFAIARGARWVATNVDTTLPTHQGLAPGNGALVGVVRHAVDVDPHVVGKPESPLYELAARVLDTAVPRTLAIGDRLDTDLAGAVRTGMPGLYVATGVSSPRDVALAGPDERPRYLAMDLRALLEPYVDVEADDTGAATCGGVRARLASGTLEVEGDGTPDERLRAVVAACWAGVDRGEDPAAVEQQVWDELAPDAH